MGLRDYVKQISPPWLIGPGSGAVLPAAAGVAERFMYSLAFGLDALAQKVAVGSISFSGGNLHVRREADGTINLLNLLPVATQLETEGSATASNRSLQWREKVIEPLEDTPVAAATAPVEFTWNCEVAPTLNIAEGLFVPMPTPPAARMRN